MNAAAGRSDAGRPARILHADWGKDPKKRWVATASRTPTGWFVEEVRRWSGADLEELLAGQGSVLAGFDFPIGLPQAFADKAEVSSFPSLLPQLGKPGRWKCFYDVCKKREEIALERPFYPYRPGETRRSHLELALGLSYQELLRVCDRKTASHEEASSLFWTLGAKQVGKAAIAGWVEVVAPAAAGGVSLWPFDGDLPDLLEGDGVAITETYPAEFYGRFWIPKSDWSKRRQADRAWAVHEALLWADGSDLSVAPDVKSWAEDGFGTKEGSFTAEEDGEDPFDAFVGALGMIRVVEEGGGARPADVRVRAIEGWILGQALSSPGVSTPLQPEVS